MGVQYAALGVVFAVALIGVALAALARLRDVHTTFLAISASLSELAAGPEQGFSIRLRDVEDAVERLPKKWEDLKRDAAAAETRARAHIRRAQKELDERGFADPGVDQMAYELGVSDGVGGEDDGLRSVPGGVEGLEEQPVPGPAAAEEDWLAEATRVKFGI